VEDSVLELVRSVFSLHAALLLQNNLSQALASDYGACSLFSMRPTCYRCMPLASHRACTLESIGCRLLALYAGSDPSVDARCCGPEPGYEAGRAVSGHVFFHEELSAWGWFGIALVGLGGYLLKLESFRRPWVPIIRFYTDPGARFVWVAIVLGVWTTHIQKLLVVSYDPFLTLFCNSLGICLCLIPSFLRRYPGIQSWRPLWAEQKTWLVLLGLVSSGSALSQFLAYSEGGNAAVVMSIKRLSVILISLYGMKILRESGGFAKAGGIFMMTLGGIYLYMS
jgi:uncharacterized membrane protein